MEIKTFADVLKLKDEFAARLEERLRKIEKPTSGTLDAVIEAKRALIEQSKARLQATEQARRDVVKRLDDEVGRHRQTIATLEREVAELRKAKASGGTTGPVRTPPPDIDPGKSGTEKADPGKPRAKTKTRGT
jgi:phage shock protein A